jgi:hypothetical protein
VTTTIAPAAAAPVLPAELAAMLAKPLEVKPCDLVSKCMASPGSYESAISAHRPSMLSIADRADRELANAWEKTQETHEQNAAAIASNQRMRGLLTDIMRAAGVPTQFREYGFQTERARTRKHYTRDAGWPKDISKAFPVDDGFARARETYETLKAKYAEYRKQAEQEQARKAEAVEAERAKRRADIALAQLILRYELGEDTDWSDALEAIRKRDQYLDLAIAGQQTRGDWSEGYWRVQRAFDRFKINDDRDKDIAADMCGCLSNGNDGDVDGRVFRDTRWNYDKLFELVNDQQLLADARLCMEHIKE